MKLNIKNDLTLCSKCEHLHLEQIRTIDKCRLDDRIGELDKTTMKGIDRALAISLGLENEKESEKQS